MVNMRNLAVTASALFGLSSAAPTELNARQTYVPGTQNNTQEFYLSMHITDGSLNKTYDGWQRAYHTGAGLADPVFAPTGDRLFLNATNLQFDVNQFPFSVVAYPSDTDYGRWEPARITTGFGSGAFSNNGSAGLQVDREEHDGWLVCEWVHGINAPQLFQMVKGFDGTGSQPYEVPSSCARVLLFPVYI